MTSVLKSRLQELAQKYEVASFVNADPSQFLRWYTESDTPRISATSPSQSQLAPGASSTKPGAAIPSQSPLAPGSSSTKPGAAIPSKSHLALRPGATIADVECASFIAAMLAFGNRKQFIPKIREILTTADTTSGTITAWLTAGAPHFPHGPKKFYRFYSFDDMHSLFTELAQILHQAPTIGNYFQKIYEGEVSPSLQPAAPSSATLSSGVPEPTADCTPSTNPCTQPAATPQRPTSPEASLSKPAHPLDQLVSQAFPKSAIVPKGKNSANKRIHMFLRWMVRTNSPVDLGIWNWYPKSELLIPLDVHVMQEGINLGLLPPNAKASRKTAAELSQKLAQAFPGDPTRGDFALFGLGVDKEK